MTGIGADANEKGAFVLHAGPTDRDALIKHRGSGRKSCGHAAERMRANPLGVLPQTRADPARTLARAGVGDDGADRAHVPATEGHRRSRPRSAACAVARRRQEDQERRQAPCSRGRPGKLFGGKVLAAYLPAEGWRGHGRRPRRRGQRLPLVAGSSRRSAASSRAREPAVHRRPAILRGRAT